MVIKGRVINSGDVSGEAVVLNIPFSFIGDFDPDTGELILKDHPLAGNSIAGKILVIPTGKGGTIAPWIAYMAAKKGNAPCAILCNHAEPITCESAITIDIPLSDSFEVDLITVLRTGHSVTIKNNEVIIE